MILSFKTEIEGRKTFFKERILCYLGGLALSDYVEFYSELEYEKICYKALIESLPPKKLTIRDDPNNRWKPGRKIHFATGARTKNYECFAEGECKEVAPILFYIYESSAFAVYLNGSLLSPSNLDRLATDDGFDDAADFVQFHLGNSTNFELCKNVDSEKPLSIIRKKVIYF